MADVILRGVKKIYPHSKDEKKKVKKAGAGDKPSEDKAKLQVTEQGVIAVRSSTWRSRTRNLSFWSVPPVVVSPLPCV